MPGPTPGQLLDDFLRDRLSIPKEPKQFLDTPLHFHTKKCSTPEGHCPYFQAGFDYARQNLDIFNLDSST